MNRLVRSETSSLKIRSFLGSTDLNLTAFCLRIVVYEHENHVRVSGNICGTQQDLISQQKKHSKDYDNRISAGILSNEGKKQVCSLSVHCQTSQIYDQNTDCSKSKHTNYFSCQ